MIKNKISKTAIGFILLLIVFLPIILVITSYSGTSENGDEEGWTTEHLSETQDLLIKNNSAQRKLVLYGSPENYLTIVNETTNETEYTPINSTVVSSSNPLYDYEVIKGLYKVYYKENPIIAQHTKFIKDDSWVTYQLLSLNYRNDLDQIQQINITQEVIGTPRENEFVYPSVFGSGINVSFIYQNTVLLKKLIIGSKSDLPFPEQYILGGGNPTLDLDLVFDFEVGTEIWICDKEHKNCELWDKKTKKETNGYVDFRKNNKTYYYWVPPKAIDSNNVEDDSLSKYVLKKTGTKLYVNIKTNYTWLSETAVFPVFIDPTVKLDDTSTEVLADLYGNDIAINIAFQIKFGNLSGIPSTATINSADLCVYNTDCGGGGCIDDDASFERVTDYGWEEGIDATAWNAQSTDTQTTSQIWNNTGAATPTFWNCLNVTAVVEKDVSGDNKNTTIRIEDLDYPVGNSVQVLDDQLLYIGNVAMFDIYNIMEDRENTFLSGNTPYLVIDYSLGNASGTSCGNVYENLTLTSDIEHKYGDCLVIKASNIYADGAGYTIKTPSSGSGFEAIYSDGFDNVTVKNFNFVGQSNLNNPIFVNNSNRFNLSNSNFTYTTDIGRSVKVYNSQNIYLEGLDFFRDGGAEPGGCFIDLLNIEYGIVKNIKIDVDDIGADGPEGFNIRNTSSIEFSNLNLDIIANPLPFGTFLNGIFIYKISTNNTITTSNLKTTSNAKTYTVTMGDTVSPVTLEIADTNISSSGAINTSDIYFYCYNYCEIVQTVNLTNTTFSSSRFEDDITGNSKLNVHWYTDVYANDSNGNALENVAINITNKDGDNVYTGLTNASGRIARQEILDYWQNKSAKFTQNNHTINGTLSGYSSDQESVNISTNKIGASEIVLTLSVTADSTPPLITIIKPTNTTHSTSTLDFNVTVNENASLCQYSLDGGTNTSLTSENATAWGKEVSGLSQGSRYVIYSCNDTSNNWNSTTKRYFIVDTIPPEIYIIYPQNTTYITTNITLNYTVIETNKGSCWYNNGSASNFTLTDCDTNTTFLSGQGSINLTLYANDTAGNENLTSRVFYVDSIIPLITIIDPANTTFGVQSIDLNVSINEITSSCWYRIDEDASNTTMTKVNNTYWTYQATSVGGGSRWIEYYCNDTLNNENKSEKRYFTIDLTPPDITIVSPTNSSYNTNSINFNVTASEDSSLCQYSLDHASNVSLIEENATAWGKTVTGISEGGRNVIFSCNDTFNNWNSTNISFFVDTVYPVLYIDFPQNTSYAVSNLTFNYTIIETNKGSCWYNNGSSQNYSLSGCNNATILASEGSTNLTLYSNDTVNNENLTSVTFYVDTIIPLITIQSPDNTTYESSSVSFNVSVNEEASACWYNNGSSSNYSLTELNTTYFYKYETLEGEGSHWVEYYCNDTLNNENKTGKRYFTITIPDTTSPFGYLIYPGNGSYYASTMIFEFNATDNIGLKNATMYTWNLSENSEFMATPYITNYTNLSGTFDHRNLTWSFQKEGYFKTSVLIYDTAGNSNWTVDNYYGIVNVSFALDLEAPYFSSGSPYNMTIEYNTQLGQQVNATDNIIGIGGWNVNDTTNFGINGSGYLSNETLLSLGMHWVNISVWDVSFAHTNTSVIYINVTDTIPPEIYIDFPANTTYIVTNITLNYTITETNKDKCWYSVNSGANTTLTSCENTTFIGTEGSNTVQVFANDTSNNENKSAMRYFTIDSTAPIITFISQSPTDLEENSTGDFVVKFNITDASGVNISSCLLSRTLHCTVDDDYYWSLRVPNNTRAINVSAYTSYGKIFRADNRNEDAWWESKYSDIYTWAVSDEDDARISFENETARTSVNLTFNGSVQDSVFRNIWYLDRTELENENKTNQEYEIYRNNPLIVKRWSVEAIVDHENYTICNFMNLKYQGTPNKDMIVRFCNSSYDISGAIKPKNSPNCVYVSGYASADVINYVYSPGNSSYVRACFGVVDGVFAGIKVTPIYYIDFESKVKQADSYLFRYANGTTSTNINFDEANVSWNSNDDGTSWNQNLFTPDYWSASAHSGDQFVYNLRCSDDLGSENISSNKTDDIGLVKYIPLKPNVDWLYSASGGMDVDLNGTHSGIMTIRVLISTDPDSEEIPVTHNMTLRNIDGSWNYTINSSFISSTGGDINVSFNTSLVSDANYRLQINVTDDENAVNSWISYGNFAIKAEDTIPPAYSGNLTTPISPVTFPTGFIYFNITWDSTESSVWIFFNGTNYTEVSLDSSVYTSSGIRYHFNKTDLGVGTYYYEWYANDSSDNTNETGKIPFVVNALDDNVDLYLTNNKNQNISLNYGEESNTTGVSGNCTANIYRDSVSKTNPEIATLGVASYNYTVTSTCADYNYTSNTTGIYYYLAVNQTVGSLYLKLNDQEANIEISYGTESNATAGATPAVILLRNGTVVTATENKINITLGVGKWNYTAYFEDTTNYSGTSTISRFLNITQTTTTTNLTLDGSETNISITYPSTFIPITWGDFAFPTLYRDGTNVSSENATSVLLGGNQTYNYTGYTTGNTNYSSSYKTWFVNVSINQTTLTSIVSPNSTTYGTTTYANCSANNDVVPTFLRNIVLISSPENVILGVAIWNYSCNYTGDVNYSSSTSSMNVSVTQASGDIDLYLEGIQANKSIDNRTYVNITAVLITGSENITIYLNYSLISNGTSPLYNNYTNSTPAIYNTTSFYSGNTNYSSNSETWWLTVTAYSAPAEEGGGGGGPEEEEEEEPAPFALEEEEEKFWQVFSMMVFNTFKKKALGLFYYYWLIILFVISGIIFLVWYRKKKKEEEVEKSKQQTVIKR